MRTPKENTAQKAQDAFSDLERIHKDKAWHAIRPHGRSPF